MQKRKLLRLKGYDYSNAGAYFVTICTYNKECIFGEINSGRIILSEVGKITNKYWVEIPLHFKIAELDEYVIMSNHIHGIVIIKPPIESDNNSEHNICRGVRSNTPTIRNKKNYSQMSPRKNTLSVIIRSYKSSVTTWCKNNKYLGFRWQRNFYDHIIRNDQDLYEIRQYIRNNPYKWAFDEENPNFSDHN